MAIWREAVNLQTIKRRSAGTLAEHLGIEFTEIGDDFLCARMPVDHRTKQPIGILNGGASCALAETVGSTAAHFCVDQKQYYCVGLDINANHLRSVSSGFVTARATPIHLGRRTQVWQIEISNDQQQLICITRLTMMVMTRESSQ